MKNIHPFFVHFPIALFSIGFVLDLIGSIFNIGTLLSTGSIFQITAFIGLIATAISGFMAQKDASDNPTVILLLRKHKIYQIFASSLFTVLIIWRVVTGAVFSTTFAMSLLFFIVYATALALLFRGAYIGSTMVFEHGVGGTYSEKSSAQTSSSAVGDEGFKSSKKNTNLKDAHL